MICDDGSENFQGLRAFVDSWVFQHNTFIPLAALGGRTPEEVLCDKGHDVIAAIPARKEEARCAYRGIVTT